MMPNCHLVTDDNGSPPGGAGPASGAFAAATKRRERRVPAIDVRPVRGFTLIEMLIVVAIIAIIMAFGIPSFVKSLQKTPIRQAVSDVTEACSHARARAILHGVPFDLVIGTSQLTVQPVGTSGGGEASAGNFSVSLPESVAFKGLWVNRQNCIELETEGRVRFYPNGTCDELVATLLSDLNEERTITLEITTGLSDLKIVR